MLGRILKVEKKVRRSVVRTSVIVWKRKNPSPFRLCLECSHKMEMKFTAVVTDEPSRKEHNLRRSVFENIFDNFFVIIGKGEFNHTGIKCRGGENHRLNN